MKPTKVVLALCMTCCMLISCKEEKNEPNQPTPPPSPASMTEMAKEIAACLTDNYAVGDSVFFRRETGETEGFIVAINNFVETIDYSELEWGEIEPQERLIGYDYMTFLTSEKDTLRIMLWIRESGEGMVNVLGDMTINHKMDLDSNLITNMAGDSITISYPSYDKSCTLRKNVGLTRVQNNSSTWDLIQ